MGVYISVLGKLIQLCDVKWKKRPRWRTVKIVPGKEALQG